MRRRTLLSSTALLALGTSPARSATSNTVRTRIETVLGAFVVEVNLDVAPITVANYLAYVDAHDLDGGSVYRVVTLANQTPDTKYKIEVVQWGMNLPDDKPGPFPPIAHETTLQTGLRHLDGTISMARDAPGTASSEFFVCVGDQPELDYGGHRNPDGQGFAAFGQVVEGMGVIRALQASGMPGQQYLAPPIAVRTVRRVLTSAAAQLPTQPASAALPGTSEKPMKRVTGIGGIFFKAKDPKALSEWYRVHLGIDVAVWGGAAFKWNGPDNPSGTGTTAWSPFKEDTTYFAPSHASFMINYRVDDLHALLAALRAEGVQVEDKVDESEYGKFGWAIDPEGNKVELWQPPAGK